MRHPHPPDKLEQMAWASALPIDDAYAWRTLLNLAEYAMPNGLAVPPLEDLQRRCRMTADQLRDAISVLERDGYLQATTAPSNGRPMFRLLCPGVEAVTPDWTPIAVEVADVPAAWKVALTFADHPEAVDPNAPTLFEAV